MAQLKIFKVDVLPPVLESSALYFIKASTSTFSIYLTDKLGQIAYRSPDSADISQLVLALINSLLNQPGGIAGLDLNGNVIGNIIATIDGQNTPLLSNNDHVWNDLITPFVIKNIGGGNNPTFGVLMGNMQGLLFPKDVMTQVWCDFHIQHDIALGTKIYPHIHWCPTTVNAGTVRWGVEYIVAKGHGQQAFGPSTTVYVETTFGPNNQWKNMLSEISDADAINSADIEPDSIIKTRIFRDAKHANDTYQFNIHAWQSDLHYQVARVGTRHRFPDFFNP